VERAVVSGISGHLGQELARQLLASGVEVHGLTRAHIAGTPLRLDGVRLHQVDGSTERLLDILKDARPDTIFHLAALARREHRVEDIGPLVQANILFGTQLLEAMRAAKCGRIVIAGSYLQHSDTVDYRALNLYAATKQAFETILDYYADEFELSAVRLTLCDIYSEYDTRRKLMTDIATAASENAPLTLLNDHALVDLVHVEDAASAFIQAQSLLERNSLRKGALSRYSISSGCDISVAELVSLFETIGGRHISIDRGRQGSALRIVKPWRGIRLPGWQPNIALHEGIKRILSTKGLTPRPQT
jgi:nucleoside-diphosphate-sugar epimerase